jgi:hypothetical protein
MRPTVHQSAHGLLCEVLRRFLACEVQSSHGAGGDGRVGCGAGAALYSLLAAHPVDRLGRCRSCGGPGWLGRRRRVCVVFLKAHYWLRQPDVSLLLSHLASELGVDVPVPCGAPDPEATDVLPRIEPDSGDRRTEPLQTPAVLSPLPPPRCPRTGRPDLDHGGAGEKHPERPRLRRGPSDIPEPGPGPVVLVTGGISWPG